MSHDQWDPLEHQREKLAKAKAFASTGNRATAAKSAIVVESVASRKSREDAERAALLVASGRPATGTTAPLAPTVPSDGSIVRVDPDSGVSIVFVMVTDDDGTSRRQALSPEASAIYQASRNAARERCEAQHATATAKAKAASRPKGAKSDGVAWEATDRGVIRPTGEGSIPPVSDADIAFEAFRAQIAADMRAGTLPESEARRILGDARKEAALSKREITTCTSQITGMHCGGHKFCQRCGGRGFLYLAPHAPVPHFLDVFPSNDPIGFVQLIPRAPGESAVLVPIVNGDLLAEADALLLADSRWSAATIADATGAQKHVATYYRESGDVETDENGRAMRTVHGSDGEAMLAATRWIASNPGARVSYGLTRSDAIACNPERERQTRRAFSGALLKMADAAETGTWRGTDVPRGPSMSVDDPRLQSSRTRGGPIRPNRTSMPLTPAMARAMRAAR